jgi:hypothetical protein
MANLLIPTNNQTSDISSQASNFLPELWKKGVQLSEAAENFFQQFEGPTESYPVMSVRDLSKGAGTKITFRTMSQLYGEGVQGETLIQDNTEDFRVGSYNLTVDFLRHAVSYNRRLEEKTALASELKSNVPVMLGNWLGRMKTERLQKLFLHRGTAKNYYQANGKASINALTHTDTLSYDGLIAAGQQLRTRGARPATIGQVGKNKIQKFVIVSTGEGLLSLKSESKYLAALNAAAAAEGEGAKQFTGGYVDLDGHVIRQFDPADHDGFGAIGSPINAKASLGVAITSAGVLAASATSFTLKGGGSATAAAKTAPKYFKFFSGYTYPTGLDQSETAINFSNPTGTASGTSYTAGYVLILSSGKYGLYKYTTNDGNTLNITKALIPSSATPGASNTLAVKAVTASTGWNATESVTLNTNAFADARITNDHAVGDLIVECNAQGVPIGRTMVLGAMAAVRGYGSLDGERSEETFDGEFIRKTYITSIFGQSPYVRVDGEQPNYLVLNHAVRYAGLVLPVDNV